MHFRLKSQLMLAFFIFTISSNCNADTNDLSQFDRNFIALLHAEKINSKYRTPLKKRKLFTTDGSLFNLYDEIEATKEFILNINDDKKITEFSCEYPALYTLFSEKFSEIEKVDFSECEFSSILSNLKKIRISFASGYLGNPASFFGHLYITPIHSDKNFENYTYNIGAVTPNGENPLLYVIRGLIGYYDTSYKRIPYLAQTNKYLRQEGRDVYEFDLNITDAERKFLFLHLIEMENHNTAYYFANKNCAYELAQLLNVIPSLREVNEKLFYYPIHLLIALKEKDKVKDIVFRASNKTQFYNFYNTASNENKIRFQNELSSVLRNDHVESVFSQQILNFGYAFVDDEDELQDIKINRITSKKNTVIPAKEINLFSRSPIKINLGIGAIDNEKNISLRFKPAFYNFVDYPSNVYPGNKITFLESMIILTEERLEVKEFVFIDIHKGELNQSGILYDNEYEWGVSANYKKISKESIFSFNGYIGKNYSFSKEFKIQYGIVTSLQSNYDSYGIVHIKPKVRILGEIFSGSRYSFEYSKSVGDKSFEELSFLFNIPLNKNFSIDFELKKTFSEKTFYLGGSYYF